MSDARPPAGKRGRGRPRGSYKPNRMPAVLRFRATDEEADEIYRAAIRSGKSVSDHLRDLLRISCSKNKSESTDSATLGA